MDVETNNAAKKITKFMEKQLAHLNELHHEQNSSICCQLHRNLQSRLDEQQDLVGNWNK